jgi:hypothetical protein
MPPRRADAVARGKRKKHPKSTDFFEDAEDWLDDDEASPPVLH